MNTQILNYRVSSNQLYHVLLDIRFCLKVYINDTRVPKRKIYMVGRYKNTNTIKIYIEGLINKKTIHLKVEPHSLDIQDFRIKKRDVLDKIVNSSISVTWKTHNKVKSFRLKSNQNILFSKTEIVKGAKPSTYFLKKNEYQLKQMKNQYHE